MILYGYSPYTLYGTWNTTSSATPNKLLDINVTTPTVLFMPSIYKIGVSSDSKTYLSLQLPPKDTILSGTAVRPTTFSNTTLNLLQNTTTPETYFNLTISQKSSTQLKVKVSNIGDKKYTSLSLEISSSGGVTINSVKNCKNKNGVWTCSISSLSAGTSVSYQPDIKVKSSGSVTSTLMDSKGNTLVSTKLKLT